jgi:hypothetical protein
MQKTPDLRILFPTSFSDTCFRTSRSIAQLAGTCNVSLTIVHVTRRGCADIGTRRELDSFLAEADHYDDCRRVLIESDDPVDAIGDLCDRGSFDLVMAPQSDRLGLQKFFSRSLRSRLLKRCSVPLWTAGSSLYRAKLNARIQTVTGLLDFDAPSHAHLQLAASLASRAGAKMRIVTVVAPTNEGTLARSIHSRAPLMPEVAIEKIRRAFTGQPCPEIDVAVGETSSEVARLLSRSDSDLAFLGPGQAIDGSWKSRLPSWVDHLRCPVVCVDGASADFHTWSFQRGGASRFESRPVISSRDELMAS